MTASISSVQDQPGGDLVVTGSNLPVFPAETVIQRSSGNTNIVMVNSSSDAMEFFGLSEGGPPESGIVELGNGIVVHIVPVEAAPQSYFDGLNIYYQRTL